jgi:type IV secretory pathway TrbD component
MRSQAFRLTQHTRLRQGHSTAGEETLAARRGTRGLLAAIGLGLAVWLATGLAVWLVITR